MIGGGVVGVSTAWELVQRGHTVELLEAGSELAGQTSFANGGMLTAGMCEPWNAPGVWKDLLASFTDSSSPMKLHPSAIPGLALWGMRFLYESRCSRFAANTRASYLLCQYSCRETDRWVREFSLDCDYREASSHSPSGKGGDLKIFRSQAAAQFAISLAKQLQELGLRWRLVDTDEVLQIEPALKDIVSEIACGLYFPDDPAGDVCAFTRQLGARLQEAGARIGFNVKVEAIERVGDRDCRLLTSMGKFSADAVVVAAANGSPGLLAPLGVNLPIKPVKGYSLTFDVDHIDEQWLPKIAVINQAMHAAVNPLGRRIRVAGTAEFVRRPDPLLSQERLQNLMNLLRATYPRLARELNLEQAAPWCGFRPMSADGKPFIGATGVPGIYVNSGHGYLGWTQAAGSARILADMMECQSTEIDSSPYAVNR